MKRVATRPAPAPAVPVKKTRQRIDPAVRARDALAAMDRAIARLDIQRTELGNQVVVVETALSRAKARRLYLANNPDLRVEAAEDQLPLEDLEDQ